MTTQQQTTSFYQQNKDYQKMHIDAACSEWLKLYKNNFEDKSVRPTDELISQLQVLIAILSLSRNKTKRHQLSQALQNLSTQLRARKNAETLSPNPMVSEDIANNRPNKKRKTKSATQPSSTSNVDLPVPEYSDWRNRGPPPMKGQKTVPEGQSTCLKDKTFLITGVMDSLERSEAWQLIRRYGGQFVQQLSENVTHIIVGLQPGEQTLERLSNFPFIRRINEDDLFQMIRESTQILNSNSSSDNSSDACEKLMSRFDEDSTLSLSPSLPDTFSVGTSATTAFPVDSDLLVPPLNTTSFPTNFNAFAASQWSVLETFMKQQNNAILELKSEIRNLRTELKSARGTLSMHSDMFSEQKSVMIKLEEDLTHKKSVGVLEKIWKKALYQVLDQSMRTKKFVEEYDDGCSTIVNEALSLVSNLSAEEQGRVKQMSNVSFVRERMRQNRFFLWKSVKPLFCSQNGIQDEYYPGKELNKQKDSEVWKRHCSGKAIDLKTEASRLLTLTNGAHVTWHDICYIWLRLDSYLQGLKLDENSYQLWSNWRVNHLNDCMQVAPAV